MDKAMLEHFCKGFQRAMERAIYFTACTIEPRRTDGNAAILEVVTHGREVLDVSSDAVAIKYRGLWVRTQIYFRPTGV